MKRYVMGVVVVLVASAVAAGGAFSATSKPWQAVGGHFKTTSAASTEVSKLSAKGYSGFTRETEKSGTKYEVSKSYATQKLAQAEVSKLHKAGFKGAAVENEKSTP